MLIGAAGVVEVITGGAHAATTVIKAAWLSTEPAQLVMRTQKATVVVSGPVFKVKVFPPTGVLVSPPLPRNHWKVNGVEPVAPTERFADCPDVIC
jgi:hypothetical protein